MAEFLPGRISILLHMGTRIVESGFGSVELRSQSVEYGAAAVVGLDDQESESLFLVVVQEGQAELLSDTFRLDLATNEGAFVSGTAFMVQSYSDLAPPVELLTIRAPIELARDLQGFDETAAMFQVPPDALLLRPLLAFASTLQSEKTPHASGFERYYAERLLQEMLLSLLVRTSTILSQASRSDYFAQAMTIIASQCTDPTFTGATAAAEVNLSLRQLERVFTQEGTSLGRAIRLARIESAIDLLRDRAHDALTITQVARFVGFSNGSSLARAMTREGFSSPVTIRRKEIN